MNNKHLTFEERSIIEDLLNKGEKIHKIAQKLGKPDSSIPTATLFAVIVTNAWSYAIYMNQSNVLS